MVDDLRDEIGYRHLMDNFLIGIHSELGITPKHLESNRLSFQKQSNLEDLEVVDIDFEGKPFVLLSSTAKAWREMKAEAQRDGIWLMPFSGFRSYIHQKNLIEKHLKNGRLLDNILTHIAIPGFSEHHSGRAVDIHTKDRAVLEEDFEKTDAFSWLQKNAVTFNFHMSYPKNNESGIIYEPWHWFYKASL